MLQIAQSHMALLFIILLKVYFSLWQGTKENGGLEAQH